MNKFKNIGIAEAGVVPDLTSVFSSMVSGFQNLSSQQQQSSNQLLSVFAAKKAKSNKLAGMVETKANNIMSATDDIGFDEVIAEKAMYINSPLQDQAFVTEEQATSTIKRLDILDVMKNEIYKTKKILIDFKKTASFENMSDEAMDMYSKVLDNEFKIGDVNKREIKIDGVPISIEELNNMYVPKDDQGIRNAQILINQHVDPKKEQFSSIGFNQDFNALIQNRNHFGALLMVNEMESGPKGSIKDQLLSNIPEFTSTLNSLGSDLDNDGTKDSEQITEENAIEFINILTKPANKNYDESTTNTFAKTILETQTSKTHLANKTAILLSKKEFNIEEFFRTNGTTGNALGNISKVMQNLSRGDIRSAKDFAMNMGLMIEKVDGNEYQLFEKKTDLRETIGKGKNEQINPNFRTFQATSPVGKKFDINKQEDIVELFQQMLRGAGVNGFNAETLYTFEQYLLADPSYLTPGPDVNFDYSDPNKKEK